MDEGRARRGARARGVPAPRGHAALPRSAQIRAPPARDLSRPLASRADRRGGRRGGRHAAADAGAGASLAARTRRLPAARRVRLGFEEVADDRCSATPPPAASSPPARALMCARRAALPGRQAARRSNSPTPFSPLRAAATCKRSARCWPPTSASMPTAAASVRRRCGRSSASRRCMKIPGALAALSAKYGSNFVRVALRQRPAGLRHAARPTANCRQRRSRSNERQDRRPSMS